MALWDRLMWQRATEPVLVDTSVDAVRSMAVREAAHYRAIARMERASEQTQMRAIDSFVDYPGLTEQLLRVQGLSPRPWRAASITEALGVPALKRAVVLISNTVGSLTMEGYREGGKMPEGPRLITRPDPNCDAQDFYRDTAWNQATRGEFVWWIASRDNDGLATALVVVPLAELNVEANPRNRLRPTYTWGDIKSTRWTPANPSGQFVHKVYARDPGDLRGRGPLQMCQAAVSVSVEAQEYAANFYAENGVPSWWAKAAGALSEDPETGRHEADILRDQIIGRDNNTVMVTDDGIEDLKQFPVDVASVQALAARDYQNGDAARIFDMPGPLLEYSASGSSLVYGNRTDLWKDFLASCLSPNYLEPIEHAMSDLLTRSTVARFNRKPITEPDIKTRYEVHAIAIEQGIYTAEVAASEEGYLPGDSEYKPMPFAPPAAAVTAIPQVRSAAPVRCTGTRILAGIIKPCNAMLAEAGPFVGRCRRCGTVYDGERVA